MNLVEALASGQTDAESMLMDVLSKDGHNLVLWKNLIEGYMPDLGLSRLAADLSYAQVEVVQTSGEIRERSVWVE